MRYRNEIIPESEIRKVTKEGLRYRDKGSTKVGLRLRQGLAGHACGDGIGGGFGVVVRRSGVVHLGSRPIGGGLPFCVLRRNEDQQL